VLEEDEEDEDLEEVSIILLAVFVVHTKQCQMAPLPIRVLRKLVGRFGGGSNAEEEGSSEDGPHEEAELDGVD